jgi:mannose-6-phosphate isomerase-like protein (cupin superfamily)
LIVRARDVDGYTVPPPNQRTLKVLVAPEVTGHPHLTALLSIIDPGYTTGLHLHEVDEFMYVVSGRGEAYISGKEWQRVEPDVLIHAPAKILHEIKTAGPESLKLFCVYAPALLPRLHFEKAIEVAKQSVAKSTVP